jgi:acyl-CoA synthetase (AMP-forming)/AMP-acid ligase II
MRDADGEIVYSDRFHGFVPAIAAGASVVLASPATPPEVTADIITTHHVTTWFTTPMTALEVLDVMTIPNRLLHIVLGSAPIIPAVVHDITRRLPSVEITAVYGMTEAVPVAVTSGAAIVAYSGDGDLVGHVIEGVDIEFTVGGEIVVSGSRVGRYLGTIPGPIRTGDVGHMTADEELVLDGRISDMILVRARNIYPQHHEHRCRELPGVTDGALVGIPNRYGDEELWMVVELDPPDTPLREILDAISSDDHLAGLPLSGLVVGQLAYSGRSKKLDRAELRRRVSAALETGSALRLDSG